jgi:hypothetical protein
MMMTRETVVVVVANGTEQKARWCRGGGVGYCCPSRISQNGLSDFAIFKTKRRKIHKTRIKWEKKKKKGGEFQLSHGETQKEEERRLEK